MVRERGYLFTKPTVVVQGVFYGPPVLLAQLGATDTDIEVYAIRLPEKPDAVVYCWPNSEESREGLCLLAFGEIGVNGTDSSFDTAGIELFEKLIIGDLNEDAFSARDLATSTFARYLATSQAESSTVWSTSDFDPVLMSIQLTVGTLRAADGMTTTSIPRELLAFQA